MTNKEYRTEKAIQEQADELFSFEHCNGFSWRTSRYMTNDDIKTLRAEQKKDISKYNGARLDARAVVLKYDDDCILLKSYNTVVSAIVGTQFIKLWRGFSVTTLKHVNAFIANYNCNILNSGNAFSKREWIEYPTASGNIIADTTGQIFTARELINA